MSHETHTTWIANLHEPDGALRTDNGNAVVVHVGACSKLEAEDPGWSSVSILHRPIRTPATWVSLVIPAAASPRLSTDDARSIAAALVAAADAADRAVGRRR